jgi:DHA1 family bicyclomycin/chloramphenicol resistance-like MFS transporter
MKKERVTVGDTLLFGGLVLLIGSIIRIGASIYLPAMPIIGENLHIDKTMMSYTLTVYFIVFASFILVAGTLSDAYGRRPVLLTGMLVFCIGSALCALSRNFTLLIAGRMLQALGASMIPGTLMAMIRDACSDSRIVSLVGWLSVLGGLFLVASPMIGGVLTHFMGWTANFWFLVMFGAIVLVVSLFYIPETHLFEKRTPLNFKRTLRLILVMLTSSQFLLVMLPVIAFFTLQGAFLAAAPYIIMSGYGLGPVEFGASNGIIVAGLFIGRWIGAKIYQQYGGITVYRYCGYATLGVAFLFLLTGAGKLSGLWSFLFVVGVFAAIFGAISPVGMKSSITAFRENSGIAAALQGATLLGASAIGSALVGVVMRYFSNMTILGAFSSIAVFSCIISAFAAFKSEPV